MDKLATIGIFILLLWWAVDEYIEGEEFIHVMDEHHAHFEALEQFRAEWREAVDTYLILWHEHDAHNSLCVTKEDE